MKLFSSLKSRYSFIQGNFLVLFISWVLMFFSGPIPSTYSSLYFKGLGANDFIIGVIGFAGSIALALVQFPGGYLADGHPRRRRARTTVAVERLGGDRVHRPERADALFLAGHPAIGQNFRGLDHGIGHKLGYWILWRLP